MSRLVGASAASKQPLCFRVSEWVLICYFGYTAVIALLLRDRPHVNAQPFYEFITVFAGLAILARLEQVKGWEQPVSMIRDWLPNLLLLVAFWEMELFLPRLYPHAYEKTWASQDHVLLTDWHLRAAIESLGQVIPMYLELCYVLVYAVGPVCIGILYARGRRDAIDRFLTVYLIGALAAYSLFPYFPSLPPRILFSGSDQPTVSTWARHLNLWILKKGTIHLSVFPSAHVSAAFSAAWGLLVSMPERKSSGYLFTFYACSVSLATIYGRYHYVADVAAGFMVSFSGLLLWQAIEARAERKWRTRASAASCCSNPGNVRQRPSARL